MWKIAVGIMLVLIVGTAFFVGFPDTMEVRPSWSARLGGATVDGPGLVYLFGIFFGVALILSGIWELRHKHRN